MEYLRTTGCTVTLAVVLGVLLVGVSMLLLPFGMIILGPALIVGGYVAYRDPDPRIKSVGAGSIAGGIGCFLFLLAVFAL